MAYRFADHSGRGHLYICRLRRKFAGGAQRWKRYWPYFRAWWFRVHDFRGIAGRAQERSNLALGPRPDLAAGALMAGAWQPADDFLPCRISVWRRFDPSADDSADPGSGEWFVWSGFAALPATPDDFRSSHGNDFRADRPCAGAARDRSRWAGQRRLRTLADGADRAFRRRCGNRHIRPRRGLAFARILQPAIAAVSAASTFAWLWLRLRLGQAR